MCVCEIERQRVRESKRSFEAAVVVRAALISFCLRLAKHKNKNETTKIMGEKTI